MSTAAAPLGFGKMRPLVALLFGALHLAVLGALVPSGNAMGVPEPVAVSIERETEVPQETAPAATSPEPSPPVAPLPEPLPTPVEAAPALPQEKPAVVMPKLAKVPPKVIPPKVIPPAKKREVVKREVVEREEAPRPRREAAKREPTPRTPPDEGRPSAAAGRATQAGAGGSSAAYAAKVRATLQGRANALGFEDVNASVVLSFTIGPSGSVSAASISRPSGDFKVDGALMRMLASSSFPPPPGGRFSGAVTVRIH